MPMGRTPTKNLNLPPQMRARKRGDVTYYYYDTGSKPRVEIPLGKDYVKAIQKWSELHGNDKKISFNFADLERKYIIEVLPLKSTRTQADNTTEMKSLREFFCTPAPAPLHEIKQIHVRQFLDWRTKKGTESTTRANREKALLSHMMNMAINWGMLDGINPCTGVKGFKETGRDIYVEDNVFNALYDVACQPLRDAIDLAYLTGQRPSDVTEMSETDINNDALMVDQGKTKVKLAISIEGQLKLLIERIKERKIPHKVRTLRLVCSETGRPLSRKAIEERFKKARVKAIAKYPTLETQIKEYQFRDLRAKAVTDKAETDDMQSAKQLAGHASIKMTEHYIRNRKGQKVSPTR